MGEHTKSLITTGENPWALSPLRATSPCHGAASATSGWLPRRQLVSHHWLVNVPRVSHALGLPSQPLQRGRARGSGGHQVCQGEDNFFQLLVVAEPVSSDGVRPAPCSWDRRPPPGEGSSPRAAGGQGPRLMLPALFQEATGMQGLQRKGAARRRRPAAEALLAAGITAPAQPGELRGAGQAGIREELEEEGYF